MKNPVKKAVIIARVSMEEQKEAGNSLPAQITRLENYCHRIGFRVIKKFSFDESAYKGSRTEFNEILSYVLEQKEVIAVCFDKVDRLSRNVFDEAVGDLFNKASNGELELHFPSDNQVINNKASATGKFQFGINLGLARYYSDAISDNVKRAREKILTDGRWPGKAPIGYLNINRDDGSKWIIIDQERATLVIKLFEWYATGMYSMELLRRKAKGEGLRNNTKTGKPLTKSKIGQLLKDPFYYGMMRTNGELYPHNYEPLISKELFDKVQGVKQAWNKQPFKYAAKPYLYRGLLHCSSCGHIVTFYEQKGTVYGYCTNHSGKCTKRVKTTEDRVTTQVLALLRKLTLPQEQVDTLLDTLKQNHESKNEYHTHMMTQLNTEYDRIEKRLEKMYDDKLDGSITQEEYDNRLKRYKKEQQDILEQMEKHRIADESYYLNANKVLDVAKRASELFEEAAFEEKQELLRFLLSNSAMDGENLVPSIKKPFDILLECQKTKDWLRGLDSNQQP